VAYSEMKACRAYVTAEYLCIIYLFIPIIRIFVSLCVSSGIDNVAIEDRQASCKF